MLKEIVQTRGFLATLWAGIVIFGAYRCFQPILHDPPECIPMEEEAVRMGFAVYKYGVYLNPYKTLDTGPTAHTAPAFPTLVAGLYHIFGDQVAGAYAVQMTEATAVVAQIALLPFVMQALGTSFVTGLLGGVRSDRRPAGSHLGGELLRPAADVGDTAGLPLLPRDSRKNRSIGAAPLAPSHRLGVWPGMGRYPSYQSERWLHLGRVAGSGNMGELPVRSSSRMDPGANRSAAAPDAVGMAELQSVPRLCADPR
jgi:hypothetical protein